MNAASPSPRELDLVVLGATGFTGRLVAEYLTRAAPPGARIGLAGRSLDRLDQVARQIRAPSHWLTITADVSRPEELAALAARTGVLATTVGPYIRHGLPVVEACARAGTHSVDLTGEVPFIRQAIDRFDALARQTGARIVNSCGFDSVPSDLGVWLLARTLGPMTDVVFAVEGMGGGVSGGTVASMLAITEDLSDPARRRLLFDPHALSPDRAAEPDAGLQPDRWTPYHEPLLGRWAAPFIMGVVNSRVVRRSNALLGHAYGRNLRYREVSAPRRTGALVATTALLPVAGLIVGLNMTSLGRKALARVLPAPGEGPDAATREKGFLKARVVGRAESGQTAEVRIHGRGDPGYQLTALMFGEAALCLAFDGERLPARAGVLTPASAMGGVLVDRLVAAGMTFEASAPA